MSIQFLVCFMLSYIIELYTFRLMTRYVIVVTKRVEMNQVNNFFFYVPLYKMDNFFSRLSRSNLVLIFKKIDKEVMHLNCCMRVSACECVCVCMCVCARLCGRVCVCVYFCSYHLVDQISIFVCKIKRRCSDPILFTGIIVVF